MKPDKWYLSYRIYIVVIGILAAGLRIFGGIEITEEQQDEIAKYIDTLVPIVMAGLALISKIKESIKIRNQK